MKLKNKLSELRKKENSLIKERTELLNNLWNSSREELFVVFKDNFKNILNKEKISNFKFEINYNDYTLEITILSENNEKGNYLIYDLKYDIETPNNIFIKSYKCHYTNNINEREDFYVELSFINYIIEILKINLKKLNNTNK